MSNDNKYSNNVRVIEELQKISDASDQKKQLIKSSQKAGATALGSVVLNTSVAKNVKNLSEFFNKIDLEVKISNKDNLS